MEVRISSRDQLFCRGSGNSGVFVGANRPAGGPARARRSLGVMRVSDRTLMQAILFFGAVSFFLGKKALNGADGSTVDPLLAGLRRAGVL